MILVSWIIWLLNLPFVYFIRLYRKTKSRRQDNYAVRAAGSGMKEPTLMIQDHINQFFQIVNKLNVVEVKIKTVEAEGQDADALAEKKDGDYIFNDTYLDELSKHLHMIFMIAAIHDIKIPGYYSFKIHMVETDEAILSPSYPYIKRAVEEFVGGYGMLAKFFSTEYGQNVKSILVEKLKEQDMEKITFKQYSERYGLEHPEESEEKEKKK